MVITEPLLSGTEAPISRLDPLFRKVCCLPGARIRVATTILKSLVQPSGYYPFLLFHMGTNDVATKNLRLTKRDFRAMGRMLKNLEAQVVVSSILPKMGEDSGRNRWAQDINTWLWNWCFCHSFGFLNDQRNLHIQGMVGPDGIHLSQREKCPFQHKLVGLMEAALS